MYTEATALSNNKPKVERAVGQNNRRVVSERETPRQCDNPNAVLQIKMQTSILRYYSRAAAHFIATAAAASS